MRSAQIAWEHTCVQVTEAAKALDIPLQLMCDRVWVGGGAPGFEQDLAGQRQTLQTAWQRLLEAASNAEFAARKPTPSGSLAAGSLADGWPVLPLHLEVPSVRTSVSGPSTGSSGTYTGVDIARFDDLAKQLKNARTTLVNAVDGFTATQPVSISPADIGRIREVADWSRVRGDDIAKRLDQIRRADSAAVTGLTGPPGATGQLVPTALMANLLRNVANPEHEREDLNQLTTYFKNLKDHPAPMDPSLAEAFTARTHDPAFCTKLATAIGPAGLTQAIRGAQRLRTEPSLLPKEWQNNPDKAAVTKQIMQFQNTTASGLAHLLASASRVPGSLPTSYAGQLVKTDPEATGILFAYGDQTKAVFGGQFMRQAATAMVDAESHQPNSLGGRSLRTGFGDTIDLDGLLDPVRGLLRAAENDVESAQVILDDDTLLTYLLDKKNSADRPGRGQAVSELLAEAAVNHARDKVPSGISKEQSVAWRSAKISTRAIQFAASGDIAPDTRFGLAKIFAMYLPDVQINTAALGVNFNEPVQKRRFEVIDHTDPLEPWPNGVTAKDGWPRFGFDLDLAEIRGGMRAIGSDEASRNLLSVATSAYTATLLDRGAAEDKAKHKSIYLPDAGRKSAELTGRIVSDLAEGDIANAKNEDERRAAVARTFLASLDLVGAGVPLRLATPLIGDYIISESKDQVVKKFSGKSATKAVTQSNNAFDVSRTQLQLQAFEAARTHGLLRSDDLRFWPEESNGSTTPLKNISDINELSDIAKNVGQETGSPTSNASEGIKNGLRTYLPLVPSS